MSEVKVSGKGIEYAPPEILKKKQRVISQALLMKIPHAHEDISDISLKIGRYKLPYKTLETLDPKSELTLDNDELNSLIRYISDNYAPVTLGEGKYVDVSGDNQKLVESFKKLLEQSGDTARLLLENEILSENVLIAASTIKRKSALSYFEESLKEETSEHFWQEWFTQNKWVLGSDFAEILDERNIDTKNIADYLMRAFDGFVDIVEIKKPNGLPFWASTKDHNNYIPSTDLIRAITQCQNYIYAIEQRCNDLAFREATKCKVIKPRCILIFGRSNEWNAEQREAYRILNASYTQISILTYDHLLARAKNMLGILDDMPGNEFTF